MRKLNIAILGGGGMCRLHSAAYSLMPNYYQDPCEGRHAFLPVKKLLCEKNNDLAKEMAERYLWQEYTDNWKQAVMREDIDVVDIVTPSAMHMEMAIEAIRHGKAVYCEKPMCISAEQGRQMLSAAKAYNAVTGVSFNKRRWPALAFAKRLIDAGELGTLLHAHGRFLNHFDLDPLAPMNWRMEREKNGVGVLCEAGCHVIDLIRWLMGEYAEVIGMLDITVPERYVAGPDGQADTTLPKQRVSTCDRAAFLGRMASGATVTFEQMSMASGEGNDPGIEIWGTRGALRWHEQHPNELQLCQESDPEDRRGFKVIEMGAMHPYNDNLWGFAYFPAGFVDNKCVEIHDFLEAVVHGTAFDTDFYDGLKAAEVVDAVEESSQSRTWVSL